MTTDGPGSGDGIGAVPSAPTEGLPKGFLTPGRVLGERYALIEKAGAGGMGTVMRAQDRERETSVAVKLLHDLADAGRVRRSKH